MPRSGFSSITCRTEIYDDIRMMWRQNENEMKKNGVNAFSDFFMMLIHSGAKNEGLKMPARGGT